jgi:hypothetical protein
MNSHNADKLSYDWWELYFIPFNLKSDTKDCIRINATTVACTIPLAIYICSIFMFSFLILSNQHYLEKSLENAKSNIKNKELTEFFELNEEATKQILQNPGMRVAISTTITLKCFVSLVSAMIIFWLFIALFRGEWGNFLDYWLICSSSLSVLVLSSLTLFVLQWSLLLFDDNISLIILLKEPDKSYIIYKLIKQVDLFNVWFLYLLSSRLGSLYQESRMIIFILLVCIFIILILVVSFIGMDFILTY